MESSAVIVHVYARGKDGYLDFSRVKCGATNSTFSVDPAGVQLAHYWVGYDNPAICIDCAKDHCRFKVLDVHVEPIEDDLEHEESPLEEAFAEVEAIEPLEETSELLETDPPEDLDNFLEAIGG